MPKEGCILLLRRAKWGLAGLAVVATLALAPAALAHSTLLETEPARDSIVQHSPKRVLLRFDEPVETALGSITVYDGEGERVDAGKILRPEPESVAVAINRELERGTYTVAWRVISADSDPIKGAWVFHVKEPGAQPGGIAAQVLEDTPFVTSVFYLGGRFLDFALMLACVGGVVALAFALQSASEPVRRRLFGVVAGLAGALALVSLVELGLQSAAAEGTSLGEGFRWEAISSVVDTRFGHFAMLRAGLTAALCLVALVARAKCSQPEAPSRFRRARSVTGGRASRADAETGSVAGAASHGAGLSSATAVEQRNIQRGRAANWPIPVLLGLAVALVFTPGLSGHASVIGTGSVIADAAHVQAASVWTGGLAFLVLGLVLTRPGRWELAATSVPRFSTTAVVSVAILITAGVINGYLQVRAWRGLWETEYGILLLVKVGLVLPLVAMGAYNNRFAVPRLRAQIASSGERGRFLRFAGAELAIMIAIVGVTAALVNAPPARTEIEMHEASETELELGPFMAHMEIDPGMVGRNRIHLMFEKGRPAEVNVSARLEERDIGPLRYRARRGMEPGAYVVRRANLAPGGEWELRVDARRGEFDLYSDTVHISIGGEAMGG
jgi:copper transport protein